MTTKFRANSLPLVYLISDGSMTDEAFAKCSENFLELVRAAVKAKISLIQIREKQISAKNFFLLAKRAAQITNNSQTLLLVNDRADIALAAKTDGVQLTANSLSASTLRQSFPADFIIGVSTHSASEAKQARSNGANFATFSPIFATPSKMQLGAPQGLKKLTEICSMAEEFPIIALGGIDETNVQAVLAAGASGFAAIRFLSNPKNLSQIVKKISDV